MKDFFNKIFSSISSFVEYMYKEHLGYIRLAIIMLALILFATILLVLYLRKKRKEKNQSEYEKSIINNLTKEEIKNISKATADGDFNPDEILKELETEENNGESKETKASAGETVKKPIKDVTSVEKKPAETETKQTKPATNGYTGKWIIFQENDKYRAKLVASNGGTLIVTECYSSLSGVKSGIETIKKNITDGNFATSIDKYGKYHFKLFSQNNRLICISEDYSNKAKCLKGIESVKRFALTALIIREDNSGSGKK